MARSERWTHGLDWNLLRTFLVIAEERSVSRAAARLLLQQPSVSAALKRLEQNFGCRLFERGKRPLTLTVEGELVFGECRDLYRSISNLEAKVAGSARSVTGLVRLRVVPQIANDAFDDVFRRLYLAHPGISIQVETANSEDIVRAVSQQILPFGICLLARPIVPLECRFLFREAFGIFGAPDHRLRGAGTIGLEDLKDERWVTFTAESLEPMVALRLGADLAGRVAVSTSSPREIRRFISVGAGIGILPLASAQRDVAEGRLWQLPVLHEGQLGADLYFICHPAAQHSPAELALKAEVSGAAMSEEIGSYLQPAPPRP